MTKYDKKSIETNEKCDLEEPQTDQEHIFFQSNFTTGKGLDLDEMGSFRVMNCLKEEIDQMNISIPIFESYIKGSTIP